MTGRIKTCATPQGGEWGTVERDLRWLPVSGKCRRLGLLDQLETLLVGDPRAHQGVNHLDKELPFIRSVQLGPDVHRKWSRFLATRLVHLSDVSREKPGRISAELS